MKIEGELLEKLAEHDHQIWLDKMYRLGYHALGECNSELDGHLRCKYCHKNVVPYAELDEETKEIDRDRWRNINDYLAPLGLTIIKTEELDLLVLVCQKIDKLIELVDTELEEVKDEPK